MPGKEGRNLEVPSAVCYLNDHIAPIPGYSWRAEPNDRFESGVSLHVTYTAVRTERELHPLSDESELVPGGARASYCLLVADLDETGLMYELLRCLEAIHLHELRELVRAIGTYWAPFHPHRKDGMKRWQEVSKEVPSFELVSDDLHFGTV